MPTRSAERQMLGASGNFLRIGIFPLLTMWIALRFAHALDGNRNTGSNEIANLVNKRARFPIFFVIGAAKSATSSLFVLLHSHPQICHQEIKEVHFFDFRYKTDLSVEENRQHYLSFFTLNSCINNATRPSHFLDATPAYIRGDSTPRRMKSILDPISSQVKMILLLREPAAREFSWYNHMYAECRDHVANTISHRMSHGTLRNVTISELCGTQAAVPHEISGAAQHGCTLSRCTGRLNVTRIRALTHRDDIKNVIHMNSFDEYINSSQFNSQDSHYIDQINNFLDYFRRDQLLILSFESLVSRTPNLMRSIANFYGIENIWGPNVTLPHVNEHITDLKLTCETYRKLRNHFAPYDDRLYHFMTASNKTMARPSMEPPFPKFESIVKTKCT